MVHTLDAFLEVVDRHANLVGERITKDHLMGINLVSYEEEVHQHLVVHSLEEELQVSAFPLEVIQ